MLDLSWKEKGLKVSLGFPCTGLGFLKEKAFSFVLWLGLGIFS